MLAGALATGAAAGAALAGRTPPTSSFLTASAMLSTRRSTSGARAHRLEVVLDGGDGVGKALGLRLLVAHAAEVRAGDVIAQLAGELGGALALHDAQARLQVTYQLDGLGQHAGVAGLQVAVDVGLDARQVHQQLAHQRLAALARVEPRDRVLGRCRGAAVAALELVEQGVVERVLDAQQGGGDVEPHRVGRLDLARVDALEHARLRLDDALQRRQAEHRQRGGDAGELVDRVLEVARRLVARAHHQVDLVLDQRQFLADLFGQLVQQRRVRAAHALAHRLERLGRGQQARQRIGIAQRGDARALAAAAAGEEQELVGQGADTRSRGVLAGVAERLELRRRAAEQALEVG
jgi:hypothetical protein